MWQIREFGRLPRIEQRLLIVAALLLSCIRLGMWLMPFRRLLQLLMLPGRSSTRSTPSIEQVAKVVRIAGNYVPSATCLAQALTTQTLLNRYGYASTLRIGVAKKPGGTLEAHAWLEHDSRVVIGHLHDLDRYTLLPALERGLL